MECRAAAPELLRGSFGDLHLSPSLFVSRGGETPRTGSSSRKTISLPPPITRPRSSFMHSLPPTPALTGAAVLGEIPE